MNILPDTEKKLIHKDFLARSVIVCMYSASGIILIFAVLFLPRIFIEQSNIDDIRSREVSSASAEDISTKEIIDFPSSMSDKTSFLNKNRYNKTVIQNIGDLVKVKNSSISIDGISFRSSVKEDKPHVVLNVRGVSRTREALSLYIKNLKDSNMFSSVSVPVSDFTKDRDLEFNMTAELPN